MHLAGADVGGLDLGLYPLRGVVHPLLSRLPGEGQGVATFTFEDLEKAWSASIPGRRRCPRNGSGHPCAKQWPKNSGIISAIALFPGLGTN